jgi:gliding motility-associated-like protein
MYLKQIFITIMLAFLPHWLWADEPIFFPTATYVDSLGVEIPIEEKLTHEAPLDVTFMANGQNTEGRNISYEWHFRMEGEETDNIVRYEENMDYTFTNAGTTLVYFRAYEHEVLIGEAEFIIEITTSKLRMPNAFTPNGDGRNDTYKPMTHESLVEFHAYIYNRYGQLLYDWTNPDAEGWDGTYRGKPVKDGVYFVLVKAKGADGVEYNIRKDVNLLRGYTLRETDATY